MGEQSLKYIQIFTVIVLMNVCCLIGYIKYTGNIQLTATTRTLHPAHWLSVHPIYKQFKIKVAEEKKRVTIIVIVSSGPRRVDRRNAIRSTWWKLCKKTGKIIPECVFLTDHLSREEKYYNITQMESKTYGDMYFQHVPGGITFGMRMLNHFVFAASRYEFDYFLRVDDDYFLCFKNLLNELPLPALERFHWGWVHCNHLCTRPDESMLLLSRDLISTFLHQDPETMLCHPFGDEMIATWSNTINLTHVWRHDNRLWHHPPSRDVKMFRNKTNICHEYIGLHGAYPKQMRNFWKNRGNYTNRIGNMVTHSRICPMKTPFQWSAMGGIWRHEPKLCITNPTWDTTGHGVKEGSYTGRE